MKFKEIVKIGLKIIGGIFAGVAMYFGIGKLFNDKLPKEEINEERKIDDEEKSNPNQQDESTGSQQSTLEKTNGDKFLKGFRNFQGFFGKAAIIVQSLSTLIESLSRVFGGDHQYYGPSPMSMMGNPGYGGYCHYNKPEFFETESCWARRVSPSITEIYPKY